MQVQQKGVVRLALELRLDRSQRVIEVVRLHGRQPLSGRAQRLVRIQLVGLLEVGLRLVVLRQLYVQDAARHVELRRPGLQQHSFADHVDADLERLVGKGDVGKVQIQADVPRLEQDGLPKRAHCLRRVARVFGGVRNELQRRRGRIPGVEQGPQRRQGILRLLAHDLYRRQEVAFLWIIRAQSHGPLKDGGGFVEPLEPGEAGGVGVERVELGVEQLARLGEMRHGRRAVPLPVLQHRQHRVTGWIARAQLH